MNDLTPSYEPETGQVILDGRPAGPAGEAELMPFEGVDLAFDRADGRLIRVIVDSDDASVLALVTRLFGPQAAGVLHDVTERAGVGPGRLTPEPGLCAALSRLARLDAARATSPVPASSPWWAAEAAGLAGGPACTLVRSPKLIRRSTPWMAARWLFPARLSVWHSRPLTSPPMITKAPLSGCGRTSS